MATYKHNLTSDHHTSYSFLFLPQCNCRSRMFLLSISFNFFFFPSRIMKHARLLPILFIPILLSLPNFSFATKLCQSCGPTPVPYPLSTAPDCGDQLYKIRCDAGTLWFDALNGSSYTIMYINPATQTLLIRPAGFAPEGCIGADYYSQGVQLNQSLPFNITSSNSILGYNCSTEVLDKSWNCSSSSVCHSYLRENSLAGAACGGYSQLCCFYVTGWSNAYRIRSRSDRCSAFESFVNLDISLPVSKWPEPALELSWASPGEPECKNPVDCDDYSFSTCVPDPSSNGTTRCLCSSGFKWDPINGICRSMDPFRQQERTLVIGAIVAVIAVFLGGLTGLLVFCKRKRDIREAQESIVKARESILNANTSGKLAKMFTAKELIKATNNFSKENLLGSGGFGEVFKGILEDGTITAVKRAKPGNTKGTDQILNEVRILCQVNHRRLVKLLGCCVELEQPLMVYEYVANGTLFEHLHRQESREWPPLTWHRRLCIAYQTAEGLAYLHFSAVPPIYHRDIKSSNILLDENLDAKVSDFGLSRLVDTNATHVSTFAQGTLGYLDPDYYLNFHLTDKSDVYSFGVVLMELLTSRRAIDFNREEDHINLVVFAKRMASENRLMDAVDPMLKEGATKMELETMRAISGLAIACLDEQRQNRPSMKDVAEEIECVISILSSEDVSKAM